MMTVWTNASLSRHRVRRRTGPNAWPAIMLAALWLVQPVAIAHAQTAPNSGPLNVLQTPDTTQSEPANPQSTNRPNENSRIEPVTVESRNAEDNQKVVAPNITDQDLLKALQTAERNRVKALQPSEFETFVERTLAKKLPRFGADLLLPADRDFALPSTATVPPDYLINVGDTIAIGLTGSVEGSVDVDVDTEGNIFLPKVGLIKVAGTRYRDLKDVISRGLSRQYRSYDVAVSIKKLRGIRVYVTGFANNPGAYTVNSLSTLVNAVLAAGGPSSGGSMRSVKLYRNGALVTDYDLYDLVLRGDRSRDAILQNEDVLYIEPLGRQVAVTGSANVEAIFELKPGDTVESVLTYAGGLNDLADKSRVLQYHQHDNGGRIGDQILASQFGDTPVLGGDILQVLNSGTLQRPSARQSVVVRIEGEVNKPDNYYLEPNTTLAELLRQAGGLTPGAFVYGTRVERLSVKKQQLASFSEAVQQLRLTLITAPLTSSTLGGANRGAELAAAIEALGKLSEAQPDGRVIIDIPYGATRLPGDLVLENNDRIVIPRRPVTVGVFGAVYRPGSFLYDPNNPERVKDYVERAGGVLRAGDRGGIIVVRANGNVLSRRHGALNARALPGDVIFLPVKTQSTSLLAKIRDISNIIFQLGISAAAFIAVAK